MGPDRTRFEEAFDVSRETLERLSTYEAVLRKWQKKINLIGPSTVGDIWWRHFADSAQLIRHLPSNTTSLADLGAGAGFPGLVLKAVAPHLDVTLIEADTRKAAFLTNASAEMGLAVQVQARRIEDVEADPNRLSPDVFVARALASVDDLLTMVAGWKDPPPAMLLLKGQNVESELISAAKCWTMKVQQFDSLTSPDARILRIERYYRADI